jgi:serine protease Do
MIPLEVASSVVLLEFERSYGLGFVAPNGRILTCFHVVANERSITAHLADGRTLSVQAVCALDLKRDLAVLDVGLLDAAPVRAGGLKLLDEGSAVFIFGMVPGEGRVRWVEATLGTVQVLGASLSVYTLNGQIPADASGSPLVGADGAVLGIVTVAEGDDGVVSLGVPWRHIEPLMPQHQHLPVTVLLDRAKKAPSREVPNHPLSLLEGSTVAGLEATTRAIAGAIQVGAPAYNEGNIEKCFRVYADAAAQLIDARGDCPGVQVALRDGLTRAKELSDVDHRAWAMRDTFDGLLTVIEKYLRVRTGAPSGERARKPTLLN